MSAPRSPAVDAAIEAVAAGAMSQRAAAKAFGVCQSAISRRVKGTSTLYGPQGEVKLTWVKEAEDEQKRDALFRAAAEAFAAELPRDIPVPAPETTDDLLTLYPIADQHLGMLAWGLETGGDDYDLRHGERLLCSAMKYLVNAAPPSKQCVIAVLGDLLHTDGLVPITPANKNVLDADSRYQKIVRVAIKSLRFLIDLALRKHYTISLIIEQGNHDPSSAIFLMECFSALFENEPRVLVDTSPRLFHCMVFGKNMIGTHHGDKVKADKLALLFAADWPKEWGATEYRVIHTGHVHQDRLVEPMGATVETHRTLAPKDAFAASGPWRSRQSMKAIVYHREYGETERVTFNPRMLEAA